MADLKTFVSMKTKKHYSVDLDGISAEMLYDFSPLEAFDRTHGTYLRFCGLWEQDIDPDDCVEVRTMADLDPVDDYSAVPTLYDMGTYNDIHIDAVVDVKKQSITLILERFGEKRVQELENPTQEYFYDGIIAVEDRLHPIHEAWTYDDGYHLVSWEDATPIQEAER